MKKAYVITYYYNNGEAWEDEVHEEIPQKVYMNLGDALKTDDFTKVEDDEYIYRSVEHKFEEDEDDLHPDEYYEHRIYECETGMTTEKDMEQEIKNLIKAMVEIADTKDTETIIGSLSGIEYLCKNISFKLPVETIEELRKFVEEIEE